MIRIPIDPQLQAKLDQAGGLVEFCDQSGKIFGHFIPVQDRADYLGMDSPHSDEELERRSREESERSLDEILRDLKRGR